jgi:hypothetical protein
METTDWLIVETLPNWKVDQRNQFSYFGLTRRFFRLKDEIKKGHRLFAHVTGKSSFADIRQVIKDGVRNLPTGGDYEVSLPYCIDTKPVLILPPEKWVSIHELKDRLKLTAGQRNWGHVFRSAPRRLDKADAAVLVEVLTAKSRA